MANALLFTQVMVQVLVRRGCSRTYSNQLIKTNYDRCILCQQSTHAKLTINTVNRANLLEAIQQRSHYGDGKYADVFYRLQRDEVQFKETITWHRRCYSITVNSKNIQELKDSYEKRTFSTENQQDALNKSFTRSSKTPYDKNMCCKASTRTYPLHHVSTQNAGNHLRSAVKNGTNDELKEAINTSDALSIDVVYHRKCWSEYVSNCNRKSDNVRIVEVIERWGYNSDVGLGETIRGDTDSQQY